MTAFDLESLRKDELMELARRADIRGRSRMTKAELIEALRVHRAATRPPEETGGPGRARADIDDDEFDADRFGAAPPPRIDITTLFGPDGPGAQRRRQLYDRLAEFVDTSRRCPWRSAEGHPCGLPAGRDAEMCVLHGGLDITDLAVPALGRLGFDTWPTLMRQSWLASYDIDPIGLDPLFAEVAWHVLNYLYFDYFRVEVEGIEHLPMEGPALVVSNHGGAALPYDGMLLSIAAMNEAPLPRRIRVAATEIFNLLPWLSHWYRKAGAVYASRADARHVLDAGHILGVFPEGERGFMKPVWNAYEVQRFGRGGFVTLAEQSQAPIVPVAIIGSEEVHPAVSVSKRLARLVRLILPDQRIEGVAVFLNPLPLPVKWTIRFLPPVEPSGEAELPDPLWLLERTETIRGTIQDALNEMLARRTTLW
jgi:1-acyl-sn-glycerol-3-phosphate acyltransferase